MTNNISVIIITHQNLPAVLLDCVTIVHWTAHSMYLSLSDQIVALVGCVRHIKIICFITVITLHFLLLLQAFHYYIQVKLLLSSTGQTSSTFCAKLILSLLREKTFFTFQVNVINDIQGPIAMCYEKSNMSTIWIFIGAINNGQDHHCCESLNFIIFYSRF